MLRLSIDGVICKLANYIFINLKTYLMFNFNVLGINISVEPQDLMYTGKITTSTPTKKFEFSYAHLCKLGHVTTTKILNVTVIDLQKYHHYPHSTNIVLNFLSIF